MTICHVDICGEPIFFYRNINDLKIDGMNLKHQEVFPQAKPGGGENLKAFPSKNTPP
jgi:hypothetical protein